MKSILTDKSLDNDRLWMSRVDCIKNVCSWDKLPLNLAMCCYARHYRYVITTPLINTFSLALFFKIFPSRDTKIIAREFYVPEMPFRKNKNIKFLLKKFFLSKIYNVIDVFIVHSKFEVSYYSNLFGLDSSKFRYVPFFSTNIADKPILDNKGYIFSAGRFWRDFPLLSKVAKKHNIPCVVVGDSSYIDGLMPGDIDPDTKVYKNISYNEYYELLKFAKLVVIPLYNIKQSVGQIVMLEAMAMGKPVIVAKVPGTVDYVIDGYNGFFYYPEDEDDLYNKIAELWYDETLLRKISFNTWDYAINNFTKEIFIKKIFDIIDRLK